MLRIQGACGRNPFKAYTIWAPGALGFNGQFSKVGSLSRVLFFTGAVLYWGPEEGP